MSKIMNKVYEVGIHFIPTLTEKEVSEEYKKFQTLLESNGEIISTEDPEKTDLEYVIRHKVRKSDGSYDKFNETYFGSIKFGTSRANINEIEKNFKANEIVLRFLLIETVKEDTRIGEKALIEEGEERAEVKPPTPAPAPAVKEDEDYGTVISKE